MCDWNKNLGIKLPVTFLFLDDIGFISWQHVLSTTEFKLKKWHKTWFALSYD